MNSSWHNQVCRVIHPKANSPHKKANTFTVRRALCSQSSLSLCGWFPRQLQKVPFPPHYQLLLLFCLPSQPKISLLLWCTWKYTTSWGGWANMHRKISLKVVSISFLRLLKQIATNVVAPNIRNLFSHSSRDQKTEIKGSRAKHSLKLIWKKPSLPLNFWQFAGISWCFLAYSHRPSLLVSIAIWPHFLLL